LSLSLKTSGTFADVLDDLHPLVVSVIEQLIRIDELSTGDELQHVLDQGLYNPHLSATFETLWTARFEHHEGRDILPWKERLLHETFEAESSILRMDALLLWLTLAGQNDLDESVHSLVIKATLDSDLAFFMRAADHWRSLGSPLENVSVEL
jgi:hypothetical protein